MEFSKKGVNLSVCSYCSKPIDKDSRTIDHLLPKSRGGVLSNNNKVPSCSDCNQLKDNLDINEFEKLVERLLFFELKNHRMRKGYLIRVKHNIAKIKNERGIK